MLTHTLTIEACLTLPSAAMADVRAAAAALLPELEARLDPWVLVSRAFTEDGDTLLLRVVASCTLDDDDQTAHARIEERLKPSLSALFTEWAWSHPDVTGAAVTWADAMERR